MVIKTFHVAHKFNCFNFGGCKTPVQLYSVESKKSPLLFLQFFPQQLGIFSPNFTHLLHIRIYAGLKIFIQLSATLTKLRHIKRDHHYMLKMSTIG